MILPDVNVLVYSYRNEADGHERYADWLTRTVSGGDELALPDHCLFGFLRIVTNKRIFADPSPMSTALAFVQRLRSARRMRQVLANDATWDAYIRFTNTDPAIKGNLVPDAYLAALAVSHGARLATTDRGFARYQGVQLVDPLEDHHPPAVELHPLVQVRQKTDSDELDSMNGSACSSTAVSNSCSALLEPPTLS